MSFASSPNFVRSHQPSPRPPRSRRLRAAIAGLAATLAAGAAGQAQTSSWRGGTGNWLTPANWSGGILPTAQNDAFVSLGTAQISGLGAAASSLSVTGGRTFNPANGQVTGNASGRVELGAGGGLATNAARIGIENGPDNPGGTFDVSGGGRWTNTQRINVGDGAYGQLDIRTGGEVRSADLWVGLSGVSGGALNLDGGVLDLTGVLTLGNGLLSGQLTVAGANSLVEATTVRLQAVSVGTVHGGTVRAVDLSMRDDSAFFLNGGVLEVATVRSEGGSPAFNLNGGVLRGAGGILFDDFPAFAVSLGGWGTIETAEDIPAESNMSGVGGLVKTGPGTLSLSRANTYLRGTSVRGGTLRLRTGGSIAHETAFEPGVGELVVADLAGDSATLQIDAGAAARAHSTFAGRAAGATGTVRLEGGVLATRQLAEGNGTGAVRWNGGTLRLTADQPALFSGFETGDLTLETGGGTIDTQGFAVRAAQVFAG
ncbi:MAG: autotransporter-associated beta strand repeat-containing protein, partial [Opitutaceae bacterium]|nr:autotransporter-associated beta strand repeat-containing protein [Opitutaceae bacterium]